MNQEVSMQAIVARLAQVKSEQNIPAALDIYHPNAELISPSFQSTAEGSKQIQQQLEIFFRLFPDYEVSLDQQAINGHVMLASGQVRLTPQIPDKVCPQIQLGVFIEFHFHQERISREIFHLDAGLICKKSAISIEELNRATQCIITQLKKEAHYA